MVLLLFRGECMITADRDKTGRRHQVMEDYTTMFGTLRASVDDNHLWM